jgi:hypothetical protein
MQVTTIKDNSFGLGFNPRKDRALYDDVIRMVSDKPEHKNLDLAEFKRFLPAPPSEMLAEEKYKNEAALRTAASSSVGGRGGRGAWGDGGSTAAVVAAERLDEFVAIGPSRVTAAALKGNVPDDAKNGNGSVTIASTASTDRKGEVRNVLEGTKPLSKVWIQSLFLICLPFFLSFFLGSFLPSLLTYSVT